jgi:hypothetical protein
VQSERAPLPIFKRPGTDCLTAVLQSRERIRESTGLTDLKATPQQLTKRLSQIDTGEYIRRPMKAVTVAELYRSSNANTATGTAAVSVPKTPWKHLSVFLNDCGKPNQKTIDRCRDARLVEGAAEAPLTEIAALKTATYLGAGLPKLPVFRQLAENNRRTSFVEDEYVELTGNASQLWLLMFWSWPTGSDGASQNSRSARTPSRS